MAKPFSSSGLGNGAHFCNPRLESFWVFLRAAGGRVVTFHLWIGPKVVLELPNQMQDPLPSLLFWYWKSFQKLNMMTLTNFTSRSDREGRRHAANSCRPPSQINGDNKEP